MKITLSRSLGGHATGSTIDVLDSIAERLIGRGMAQQTDTKQADPDASKRTRRGKQTATKTDVAVEGGGGDPLPPASAEPLG